MKKKNEEISFKDLIAIFLPKLWLIAIVAVVCSAFMGVYSGVIKKDTYTASSLMYVYKDSASINFNDAQIAETMIDNYRIKLYTDDMLAKIVNALPSDYDEYNVTMGMLRQSISFSNQKNGMFKISVTTPNPQLSFALMVCVENIAPVEFRNINVSLGIDIMDSTKLPKAPDSKNVPTNVLIGFAAGAFVSALAVWIFTAFDTSIDSKKKIEDNFDIPVLGVIPEHILEKNASEGGRRLVK